jgi:anti-anti-sigma factor
MGKGLQDLIRTRDVSSLRFSLRTEVVDDAVVVTVTGELDLLTVPELREALSAAVDAGTGRIVLDLVGVSFIDSVSIAAIVNSRRRLGPRGRLAVAIVPDSYSMLIFEIGGVGSIVELFDTREAALAAHSA